MTGAKWIGAALLLAAGSHAQAPIQPLGQRVEAVLQAAGRGPHWGLVVADETGRELVVIDPDGRFVPASNNKIFVTAAILATLEGLDQPDVTDGAAVRLETYRQGLPDVVLEGHGDARLSSAPDCVIDCLATLANAVAGKVRAVHDLIADDSLYPDERWSTGMSWNNLQTRSGTAISALTLDDNELSMTVRPGVVGAAPQLDGPDYYRVDNRAVTIPGAAVNLAYLRDPGSDLVRLIGTIGADAKPEVLHMGIDDPALYAAWRFKALLKARGVRVTGKIDVRHRPVEWADDGANRGGAPAMHPPSQPVLARLVPPPLYEDVIQTNKRSQNVHAELLLRRLSVAQGSGSVEDGLAAVRAVLDRAKVPRADYDAWDGSGMSTYDRITPRGMTTFLRWIAAQPWGGRWRATLPVGGEPGTLRRRFHDTPLDGKLFAKTGTLKGSTALSGYLIAKSGRTLTFAAFANDVPDNVQAAGTIDSVLQLVAAEN